MSLASRFSLLALIAILLFVTGNNAGGQPPMPQQLLIITEPDGNPVDPGVVSPYGTVTPNRTVTTKLWYYWELADEWFEIAEPDSDSTTGNGHWATNHGEIDIPGMYAVSAVDGILAAQIYFTLLDE